MAKLGAVFEAAGISAPMKGTETASAPAETPPRLVSGVATPGPNGESKANSAIFAAASADSTSVSLRSSSAAVAGVRSVSATGSARGGSSASLRARSKAFDSIARRGRVGLVGNNVASKFVALGQTLDIEQSNWVGRKCVTGSKKYTGCRSAFQDTTSPDRPTPSRAQSR